MEQFAFQQPPKNKQRRCTLRRWRQTVPDVKTDDTECTVACGGLSRPRDVQSGRGRGSQPSAWLQGCHRLQLVSKVWRSSTTETTENEHSKFKLNALRLVQTTMQFHAWAVALCARNTASLHSELWSYWSPTTGNCWHSTLTISMTRQPCPTTWGLLTTLQQPASGAGWCSWEDRVIDLLTEHKIYRKTHEVKAHYFLLKCVTKTRNLSARMCTAHAKNSLSIRFINITFKFCFWGLCPQTPPGLCPWTLWNPDPSHRNPATPLQGDETINFNWSQWVKGQGQTTPRHHSTPCRLEEA